MTWTYDGTPDTNRERVRLLIGDTDTNDQQFNDAEVDWFLTENSSDIYRAGAAACETLAAKYSRRGDQKVGDLRIDWRDLVRHYLQLADRLEARDRLLSPPKNVFAGGISAANVDSYEDDTDRVSPAFIKTQHDFPGTNQNPGKTHLNTTE